jgi:hypothetical protein
MAMSLRAQIAKSHALPRPLHRPPAA